ALKVFHPRYQTQAVEHGAAFLRKYCRLPGLAIADRQVIGPGERIVSKYPALAYAVIMPWVVGTTCFDVFQASKGAQSQRLVASMAICSNFVAVLNGLERCGLAHTDLSPGNVIVNGKNYDVNLIDLEDLFHEDREPPYVKSEMLGS